MKFFNVKSPTEVKAILREINTKQQLGSEIVHTLDAVNRVISKEIISRENVPEYNRSTVDGYAIISTQSHGATESIPSIMSITGSVSMGVLTSLEVGKSEAVYVPTGAMVPKNADGIIMIEDCEILDERTIGLMKPISTGENIIFKGDDIKSGDLVLNKGKKISHLDIGVLAALGQREIEVYKKPVITIISTGDEIIDIDKEKKDGEIFDINGNVISSLLISSGAALNKKIIVKDDYEKLYNAVLESKEQSDIIIISGGSSVGTLDFTFDVINNLDNSTVHVEGISIKPGKPTIIATSNNTLVVGLPGHPLSSIIIYKAFIDFYIGLLLKQKINQRTFKGILKQNVHSSPGKTTYQLIEIEESSSGIEITPIYSKSGMISLLAKAHGYIVIDEHREGIKAGEVVKGFRFG